MKRKIICVLLVLCTLFSLVFTGTVVSAEGTEKQYSDVLDDLKKDPTFAVSDFEVNDTDYSLNVIQIAEGTNKELFLYVHNPSYKTGGLIASDVVMWDDPDPNPKNFTPKAWSLKHVSSFEQYDKYLVENYTVSSEIDRYYNFSELLVPYDESKKDTVFKDKELINGEIDKVAYKVGQQWHVNYYNDVFTCEKADLKVAEITINYNGEILFMNGGQWGVLSGFASNTYAHYVVFECDNYKIKHIYDADMSFYSQSISEENYAGNVTTVKGESVYNTVTLKDTDKAIFDGKGIFSEDYSWNRIMTAPDFKTTLKNQGVTLNADSEEKLKDGSFVFAFFETPYSYSASNTTITTKYTDIYEVGILRLHFADLTGKEYNLGVVGDFTSSDGAPDGSGGPNIDLSSLEDGLQLILLILGLILLVSCLSFVAPILSVIINIVVKGLSFILKVVISIIALPFKLLSGDKRKKP